MSLEFSGIQLGPEELLRQAAQLGILEHEHRTRHGGNARNEPVDTGAARHGNQCIGVRH